MQEGRGMGILCIHIADSLCYTAETNTTLSSNYTPIKMLKKKVYMERQKTQNSQKNIEGEEQSWRTDATQL